MFQNPIQTTTQAAGAGTVVPSSGGTNLKALSSVVSGGAQIASLLFKPEDTSSKVKDLVLQRSEEYQRVKDNKGQGAAERWLIKTYQTDLSSLKKSGDKDVYQEMFKTTLGESPIKSERDRENELLEQKAKAELTRRTELHTTGREVVLGLGMNPDEVGEDDLIKYGEKQVAMQRKLSFQAQELQLEQQQDTLASNKTTKQARFIGDAFLAQAAVKIDIGLSELSKRIQDDPAKAESLKTSYVSQLSLQIARADSEIRKAVRDSGGDPTSLPAGMVDAYVNELKATRDYLNSEHIKTRLETRESIAKLDATGALRQADPAAYNLVTLAPEVASAFSGVVRAGLTQTGAPDSTENTFKVLAEVVQGPAAARVKYKDKSPLVYKAVGQAMGTASKMNPDVRAEYVTKGAEIVSNALLESLSPNKKVRAEANSATGMHEAIKIMKSHNFEPDQIQAIRVSVEENGMTLEDVMQSRLRTFVNESLLPSLRAPALADKEGVPYTAELKNGILRLEPVGNSERSASEFSGIARSIGNQQYRSRLKQMERVLNDEIQVYSKLTGGSAEDLAEVIYQALGIGAKIQTIESGKE